MSDFNKPLDGIGLSKVTSIIKGWLSKKQDNLSVDSTLNMNGSTLGVSLPTKEISREQLKSMSEAELNANIVYIVPGEDESLGSVSSGFPSGGIIMWSGSYEDIPDGWQLCDGTNGTPDLRGRFVLGAAVGPDSYLVFESTNQGVPSSTSQISLVPTKTLYDVTISYVVSGTSSDYFRVYDNNATTLIHKYGNYDNDTSKGTYTIDMSGISKLDVRYITGTNVSKSGYDMARFSISYRDSETSPITQITSENIGDAFSISYAGIDTPYRFKYEDSLLSLENDLFYRFEWDTGGESQHRLITAEQSAHSHIEQGIYVESGSPATSVGTAKNIARITNSSSGISTAMDSYFLNYGLAKVNNTFGRTTLSTGSSGSNYLHNNIPPYYALCYIMKL